MLSEQNYLLFYSRNFKYFLIYFSFTARITKIVRNYEIGLS